MSDPHDHPVRVQYADTDAGGIVHHAACLRWFEAARAEWLSGLGIEAASLLRDTGLALAISAMQVEFRQPAALDDRLLIRTRVRAIGLATLEFDQQVRAGDDTVIDGRFRLVCIDTRRRRPARLPEALARGG